MSEGGGVESDCWELNLISLIINLVWYEFKVPAGTWYIRN